MNEPSVLDYLKSVFKNWNAFKNFVKAIFERRDTTQLIETEVSTVEDGIASHDSSFDLKWFPWRTLFVLLLALAGQKMFEPPQQLYYVGIVLYISALGMLLLALRHGEWSLTSLPPDETRMDSFSVRVVPFVLSLLFGAAAFYKMSGNL